MEEGHGQIVQNVYRDTTVLNMAQLLLVYVQWELTALVETPLRKRVHLVPTVPQVLLLHSSVQEDSTAREQVRVTLNVSMEPIANRGAHVQLAVLEDGLALVILITGT
jgi:hypothetical protein